MARTATEILTSYQDTVSSTILTQLDTPEGRLTLSIMYYHLNNLGFRMSDMPARISAALKEVEAKERLKSPVIK